MNPDNKISIVKNISIEWKNRPIPLLDKPHILAVNDDKNIIEILEEALSFFGYKNIISCYSAFEAIEIFKLNHKFIDLILLNLTMPGFSGYETIPLLIKINPMVRILIVSGYPYRNRIRSFPELNVSGIINVPFDAKELINKIENALPKEKN
jgi:DNA-binding NtrC family response regulator